MQVFVQFEDASEEVIIATFSSSQDPSAYEHLGVVEDSDPRYLAFLATLPKPF